MTTAEKLASIKASKEAIKKAIQAKGVSCGDVLSDYSTRIQAIPVAKLQSKNYSITENGSVTITPDSGYDGISGGTITTNVVTPTQDKSIEITTNGTTSVLPDDGYKLNKVDVTTNVVTPSQDIEVTINTNGVNTISPDEGKLIKSVKVTTNVTTPSEEKTVTITENGSSTITPTSGKLLSKVNVTTNVTTPSEEKSVTVTENGTSTVVPTSGKLLSKVTVSTNVTTPSQDKSVTITSNGTTSVTPDSGYKLDKVNVTVNVPSTTTEKFTVYNGMKFRGEWTQSSTSKMNFSNVTSTESMFQECLFSGATSFNFTFNRVAQNRMTFYQSTFGSGTTLTVNLAGGRNISCDYTFAYSSVDTINLVLESNFSNDVGYFLSSLNNTFHGCTASTISVNVTPTPGYEDVLTPEYVDVLEFTDTFKGCSNLVNLSFDGITQLAGSLDLSECVKLSGESLVNLTQKLKSVDTSLTLTVSSTLYSSLDEDVKSEIENNVEGAGWQLVTK